MGRILRKALIGLQPYVNLGSRTEDNSFSLVIIWLMFKTNCTKQLQGNASSNSPVLGACHLSDQAPRGKATFYFLAVVKTVEHKVCRV